VHPEQRARVTWVGLLACHASVGPGSLLLSA
jgi:hypothetical protein